MSRRETTQHDDDLRLILLLVLMGRGGAGKTFLLRWICERAIMAKRPLVIADGDRTNRTLPLFLDGVRSPTSSDNPVVTAWFEKIFQEMILKKLNVILDLGGGDLLLREWAIKFELQRLLEAQGVTPVGLHLIGPEIESLSVLAAMEDPAWSGSPGTALFAPGRTVLVLNEALVPNGQDPHEVFEPIRRHSVFKAALRRGAVAVAMPALLPALDVNRRHLSFAGAVAGQTAAGLSPLGIFDRQRVAMWLVAMEKAFAPVGEWLP
ncbi:MAG: zeta toxin family protein [Janthinobacterium lividum]